MADKTIRQLQADWVSHGSIARIQAQLNREPDPGKRKELEALLLEQRSLISPE